MLTPVVLINLPQSELLHGSHVRGTYSSRWGPYGETEDPVGVLRNVRFTIKSGFLHILSKRVLLVGSDGTHVVGRKTRVNAARAINQLTDSATRLNTSNGSARIDTKASSPFQISFNSDITHLL